jgi:hypothetical protein
LHWVEQNDVASHAHNNSNKNTLNGWVISILNDGKVF